MSWPDLTDPSSLTFSYDNLALNLGQFLTNFVGPIVTRDPTSTPQPIQSVINVLTTPIPGLDQLPGLSNFSLLTLLSDLGDGAGFGSVADAIHDVATLVTDINSHIDRFNNVSLPFGSFTLERQRDRRRGPGLRLDERLESPGEFAAEQHQHQRPYRRGPERREFVQSRQRDPGVGLTSRRDDRLNQLNSNANIAFPLLDNPSQLLNLLFGQDVVDLVTFNAQPQLSSSPITFFRPTFLFGGRFTVNVSLSAGFSASGVAGDRLRHLRDSRGAGAASNREPDAVPARQRHRRRLLRLSNRARTSTFSASTAPLCRGRHQVDLGLASAGASVGLLGGVTANVTIALNPNAAVDDKIRLSGTRAASSTAATSSMFPATSPPDCRWPSTGIPRFHRRSTTGNGRLCNFGTWTLWSFSSANSSSSAPPVIAGISPDAGPTAGGTDVVDLRLEPGRTPRRSTSAASRARSITRSDPSFIEVSHAAGLAAR